MEVLVPEMIPCRVNGCGCSYTSSSALRRHVVIQHGLRFVGKSKNPVQYDNEAEYKADLEKALNGRLNNRMRAKLGISISAIKV